MLLAASTDATHTNFILPRRYQSSAVIQATVKPSYDSDCTAKLTLSKYNYAIGESTSGTPVAETVITPTYINTTDIYTTDFNT